MEFDLSDVTIDDQSPVPAYHQLHEAMRARISEVGLEPGARLPTERELSRQLDLSRATVRKALAGLEREGLLNRRQGDGTYVAEARIEHEISALRGFTAELARRGLRVSSHVVSARTRRPTRQLREALAVPDAADAVFELRRVRSLDAVPLSYETAYLPTARVGRLVGRDLENRSLYATLRELGVRPASGRETLSATVLDEEAAELLGVAAGQAAFVVQRETWDDTDQPIEVVTTLLRADRFSIQTALSLREGEATTTVVAPRPAPPSSSTVSRGHAGHASTIERGTT